MRRLRSPAPEVPPGAGTRGPTAATPTPQRRDQRGQEMVGGADAAPRFPVSSLSLSALATSEPGKPLGVRPRLGPSSAPVTLGSPLPAPVGGDGTLHFTGRLGITLFFPPLHTRHTDAVVDSLPPSFFPLQDTHTHSHTEGGEEEGRDTNLRLDTIRPTSRLRPRTVAKVCT